MGARHSRAMKTTINSCTLLSAVMFSFLLGCDSVSASKEAQGAHVSLLNAMGAVKKVTEERVKGGEEGKKLKEEEWLFECRDFSKKENGKPYVVCNGVCGGVAIPNPRYDGTFKYLFDVGNEKGKRADVL